MAFWRPIFRLCCSSALRKARAERKAAFLAHREAIARRDTRAIRATRTVLTRATLDVLRLERANA